MTYILFKPHVYGSGNSVTTPDILIDKLYITYESGKGADIKKLAVNKLSSVVELEVDASEISITPAYMLVSAGGGTLLSIAALVQSPASDPSYTSIIIPRYAWRLRYVNNYFDKLDLAIITGAEANTSPVRIVSLGEMPNPEQVVGPLAKDPDVIPRGIVVICPASKLSQTVGVPTSIEIFIEDKNLKRKLIYRPNIVSAESDSWEKRPLPRYEVGPTNEEVKHYI